MKNSSSTFLRVSCPAGGISYGVYFWPAATPFFKFSFFLFTFPPLFSILYFDLVSLPSSPLCLPFLFNSCFTLPYPSFPLLHRLFSLHSIILSLFPFPPLPPPSLPQILSRRVPLPHSASASECLGVPPLTSAVNGRRCIMHAFQTQQPRRSFSKDEPVTCNLITRRARKINKQKKKPKTHLTV